MRTIHLSLYFKALFLLSLVGCTGAPGAGGTDSGVNSGFDGGNGGGADMAVPPMVGPVVPIQVHSPVVTYAGGAGSEHFNALFALSDGTVLVGGGADSLDWLPVGTPVSEIPAIGIKSTSTGHWGYLLQLSGDLGRILRVVRFPRDTVRDVLRIRTNTLPGQPTGDLYLSGSEDGAFDGYYLARLDKNFINGTPGALVWSYNVNAPEGTNYKAVQPWDVSAAGHVTYGEGREFDYNWAQIGRLGADGKPEVVEHWNAHWSATGEWDGTPASSHPNNDNDPLQYSAIVMKAGRKGTMRSALMADYALSSSDENGNPGRQGRFPDDYYFSGPCPFDAMSCPGGPGYTGYKVGAHPTQRVGDIVVDRRNGDLYYGYSTQTTLPGGQPDFEPAVVAMDSTGQLKWWARLYRETKDNSSPDQFVDRLAIDYTSDSLVVLARSHGNNTVNYWSGDKVAAHPGEASFHNQFTGTVGNIHISWLGRLNLSDGKLQRAAWVAEYPDGMKNTGKPYADPNLDNWPDHNDAWPDLNTTRVTALEVDAQGRVYMTGVGRRTITTKAAYQKMNTLADGVSVWSHFVRAYTADFKTLAYSSILVGAWDPKTGAGAGDGSYVGLLPVNGGVLFGGWFIPDKMAPDSSLPTSRVPSWGGAMPQDESAVLAALPIN